MTICFVICLIGYNVFGSNVLIDTIPVVTKVDRDAVFDKNGENFKTFIEKNIQGDVPKANGAPNGSYEAVVRFIVNTDGSLSNIEAVVNPGYGTVEELIRVIRLSSGNWKPGIKNGKEIKALKVQPITFKVSGNGAVSYSKFPATIAIVRNYGFEFLDAFFKPISWINQNTEERYIITFDTVHHKGAFSILIVPKSDDDISRGVGLCNTVLTRNFFEKGRKITISAFIKTENVSDGVASVWMQLNGSGKILADKNSDSINAKGTLDWEKHTIELLLPDGVLSVGFGCKMTGRGKAWFDDFEVKVDGVSIK